jgi:uncharacterized cupredoxin-like copper-binding protein
MASGKGIVLGLAGLGGVALLLRAASGGTSAKSATQQTYVDKTLAAAKAKATSTTAKGSTVDKAKGYAAKGTAEAQSAINAINNLLK